MDVAAACLHTHGAHDQPRLIAQALVFLVGEGLGRGHGDAVAGVDAHRVEVFDGADHDKVVGAVAHHLQLVLLPADERFFHQHRVHRTLAQTPQHLFFKFVRREDCPRAAAAEGEAGADEERVAPDLLGDAVGVFERAGQPTLRRLQADLVHGLLEELTVFGHLHGAQVCANQLDAIFGEDARLGQGHAQVEAGLPAHSRQDGIRSFRRNDLLEYVDGERFYVGGVGHLGVGHNRGRVRVNQDDAVAFLAQRLTRLRAGIIKFTGLADHNGAGADDED